MNGLCHRLQLRQVRVVGGVSLKSGKIVMCLNQIVPVKGLMKCAFAGRDYLGAKSGAKLCCAWAFVLSRLTAR